MKINYCLPIIKNKKVDVLKIIEENTDNYDYFEVWLDYIEDLNEKFVKDLINQLKNKAIFLFRRKKLEKIKMSNLAKQNFIKLLTNTESYLDLDINQQKEEIIYIKANNLKLQTIFSYHNYEDTPNAEKLQMITDIIIKHKPTILKISTMCKSKEDGLRLLHLLLKLNTKKIKCIISGMGENGKITKIFGALWGNEMTFAPIELSERSAPGQFSRSQLNAIFTILNT